MVHGDLLNCFEFARSQNKYQTPMNTKIAIIAVLAAGLFLGCVSHSDLAAKARISKADAQKTALTKVTNGKVVDSELEEEKGRLIWSFDLATPGTKDITEVHVDAITGEIVTVENESPADQAREKKDKANEKPSK